MKTMSNRYKQKENLGMNQNTCLSFKQKSTSKIFRHSSTIKEKNKIRCEMNNEVFHYYW